MTFAHPWLFLLLLLLPLFVFLYIRRQKRPATFTLSTANAFRGMRRSLRSRLTWIPFALLLIAYSCMVAALARPQSFSNKSSSETEGINIMMSLDISGSMLARDLQPNRVEAAKAVASEFISSREHDNIGLVIFAGESFTQCPLTTDHAILLSLLCQVDIGLLEDGTAIGDGLATAVNRLKDQKGDSKVVILLTDGTNNAGTIDPMTAAEIAKSFGIRVYTIAVGTMGQAPYPVMTDFGIEYQMMPVEIDESSLRTIAETTGGSFFRATDNSSLEEIYDQIDQMEKIKLEVHNYTEKSEHFMPWLCAALLCLFGAILLRTTAFRTMP